LDGAWCFPRSTFSGPTAPRPPRQARQGLYLTSRGFDVTQDGHMGRPQHCVRNSSELGLRAEFVLTPEREDDAAVSFLALSKVRFHSRGGRDDEQARQSGALAVTLESRGMSLISRDLASGMMQMGVGPENRKCQAAQDKIRYKMQILLLRSPECTSCSLPVLALPSRFFPHSLSHCSQVSPLVFFLSPRTHLFVLLISPDFVSECIATAVRRCAGPPISPTTTQLPLGSDYYQAHSDFYGLPSNPSLSTTQGTPGGGPKALRHSACPGKLGQSTDTR
jgi:hypothetical protein